MFLKNHLRLLHRRLHWTRAGVIFIHVPKSAGTSVSSALYGRFLGHHTATKIQAQFPRFFENHPSFGIVRNPWDRCVSAYRFAKRPRLYDGKTPSIDIAIRRAVAPYDVFDDFVCDWLQHQNLATTDYVFQNQSRFLLDSSDTPLVDFIGQVERMDLVQSWLNDTMVSPKRIQHMNTSGKAISYREWYSPKTRDLVGALYASDIQNFGYEF